MQHTEKIHIALVGDNHVGKSSLVLKYIVGKAPVSYDATIEDVYQKDIYLGYVDRNYPIGDREESIEEKVVNEKVIKKKNSLTGTTVNLTITDCSGSLVNVSLQDDAIRQADGVIVVFALNSITSFNRALSIISTINNDSSPLMTNSAKSVKKIMLVGNKNDIHDGENISERITNNVINLLNSKIIFDYIEVNTSTSVLVHRIFDHTCRNILLDRSRFAPTQGTKNKCVLL